MIGYHLVARAGTYMPDATDAGVYADGEQHEQGKYFSMCGCPSFPSL